jgi:hypothetical protein
MSIGVGSMGRVQAFRWTPQRIDAAAHMIVERITADFGEVTGHRPDLVQFRNDPGWATDGVLPPGRSPGDPARPEDVIVRLLGGRSEFPADLDEGGEHACWLVASRLQDDVIDALGRPWPELRDGEGSVLGIAEPQLEPVMLAHWAVRGDPLCAIGHLHMALGAAGLELR